MMKWIARIWRRLFPVRARLNAEQTRQFEEMLSEFETLDRRRIHPQTREKIQMLQRERLRLRRALKFYSKHGNPREPALAALEVHGDDPLLWETWDGGLALDGYVAVVVGDE